MSLAGQQHQWSLDVPLLANILIQMEKWVRIRITLLGGSFGVRYSDS